MDLTKLTDDQFAEAAKKEPWAALKYAKDRLTDDQFAEAAKARPWAALVYAKDRVSALGIKL